MNPFPTLTTKLFSTCILMYVSFALLSACTKKEKSDPPPPVIPKVEYPDALKLTENNNLIYAEIKAGIIRGFNETQFFETSNDFKTFTTRAFIGFSSLAHEYKVSGDNVAIFSHGVPFELRYSNDFGQTMKTIKLPVKPFYSGSRSYGFNDVYWLDNENLMIATTEAGVATSSTLANPVAYIWKAHLPTNTLQLLSSITGFGATSFDFDNTGRGWLVLIQDYFFNGVKKFSNNVALTNDGGKTWTTPKLIDSFWRHDLRRGSDGHLFLFSTVNNGFLSTDNGITWKSPQSTLSFGSLQVFDASTLYATDIARFYKSNDGGSTWLQVPEKDPSRGSLGTLNFSTKQVGVAFYEKALFVTRDAGETWKRLIYPE